MIYSFSDRLEPPPIDYLIYSLMDYLILLVDAPGMDYMMDSLMADYPAIDYLIIDYPAIDYLIPDS